jgi:hypothetical protein
MPVSKVDATHLIRVILAARQPDATICPSEIARQLAICQRSPNWRHYMPFVHAAIDNLVSDGEVSLSWKAKPLASRNGPLSHWQTRPVTKEPNLNRRQRPATYYCNGAARARIECTPVGGKSDIGCALSRKWTYVMFGRSLALTR